MSGYQNTKNAKAAFRLPLNVLFSTFMYVQNVRKSNVAEGE